MASLSSLWSVLARSVKDHIRYHATREQLGALSDRELADLCIARADIPFIAREDVRADVRASAHGERRPVKKAIAVRGSTLRPV